MNSSSRHTATPIRYHADKWQPSSGLAFLRVDGAGPDMCRTAGRLSLKGIQTSNQGLSKVDFVIKQKPCLIRRRDSNAVRRLTRAGHEKSPQSVPQGVDGRASQSSAKQGDDNDANQNVFSEDSTHGEVPRGSAYEKARSLLSSLSKGVSQLETDITSRRKDLGHSTRQIESILRAAPTTEEGQALREAEERVRKLQVMVQSLQRERSGGEQKLHQLQVDYQQVYQKLKEAEKAAAEAEVLRGEAMAWQEEKSALLEELEVAKVREGDLLRGMQDLEEGISQRDSLLQQLQQEALLSSSALQQAAKAMVAARDRTLRMEEQLEHTGDLLAKEQQNSSRAREVQIQLRMDLAEARQEADEAKVRLQQLAAEITHKDELIESTKEQALKTRKMLDLTSKSLQEARQTIDTLERRADVDEQVLREEIEASSGALQAVAQREQYLRAAESKVLDLSAELVSLKEEMTRQESSSAALRQETVRNAKMLLEASHTRQELESAQKQIGQLSGQVATLEEEVRSKDALLSEIRMDSRNSASALQVASRYKQELNEVREREAVLKEELQAKEALLDDLKQELSSNGRAQQADQALRQAVSRARGAEAEAAALRGEVEAAGRRLQALQHDLHRSAQALRNSAATSRALKELQQQVEYLKAEVNSRGGRERERAVEEDMAPVDPESSFFHFETANTHGSPISGVQTRRRTAGQWSRTTQRKVNSRGYPLKSTQSRGSANTKY